MVPVTVPPKVTAVAVAPLQSVWLGTVFTVGVGFTVMVNVIGVPGQLPATGVTVTVEVTGAVPVFVAVKEAILPDPEVPRPMDALLFVQLYPVTPADPVKAIAAVGAPLQIVWLATGFTVGVGTTVTVCVAVADVQPFTTTYKE